VSKPSTTPSSSAPKVESIRSLRTGFLASVQRYEQRPALALAGESLTYRELYQRAVSIAATLERQDPESDPRLTAVFGHRSFEAFAGILGSLLRGHGYVPLNPGFPAERSTKMLQRSGCRALVVDEPASKKLVEVVSGVERPLVILLPGQDDVAELAAACPQHTVLGSSSLESGAGFEPVAAAPDDIAYLLFTSGSTGEPKGVMVAHRNVTAFLDYMVERYQVSEHDRFSQTFDLTFDLSVFDMFCAWERGACVCCPTQSQKMFPGKYVREAEISIWFSVPSTAVLMDRLKMLKPGAFPNLRYSLFCGEALQVNTVERWQAAAPNSVIENLYGPTELTIACTLYPWDAGRSPAESNHGIVPIGGPYPGMEVLIADESLREVSVGEPGELLMRGPQLTLGYYRDAERTAAAFVVPPGRTETFYRTGDLVCWPPNGPMQYLGRVDNQIKIQGYRVELGEVESVLRDTSGVAQAIAVGWPVSAAGADGIVGILVDDGELPLSEIRDRACSRLPPYMQPSEVVAVADVPLNANGKVDRKALVAMLDARQASASARGVRHAD
jgi:amino acid adenylation domain-containing protein